MLPQKANSEEASSDVVAPTACLVGQDLHCERHLSVRRPRQNEAPRFEAESLRSLAY